MTLYRYWRSENRKGSGWHFGTLTRRFKKAGVEWVELSVIQPRPRKRRNLVILPAEDVQLVKDGASGVKEREA